jgi:hypothetical protein
VRIRWAARYSLPAISVESIERCVLTEDMYSQRPPDIVTATLGFQGRPLPCGASKADRAVVAHSPRRESAQLCTPVRSSE